jgi:hypothetical protein
VPKQRTKIGFLITDIQMYQIDTMRTSQNPQPLCDDSYRNTFAANNDWRVGIPLRFREAQIASHERLKISQKTAIQSTQLPQLLSKNVP